MAPNVCETSISVINEELHLVKYFSSILSMTVNGRGNPVSLTYSLDNIQISSESTEKNWVTEVTHCVLELQDSVVVIITKNNLPACGCMKLNGAQRMWSKLLFPGTYTSQTGLTPGYTTGPRYAAPVNQHRCSPPCLPPPLHLFHISQPPFSFLSFDLFTAEPAFQCSFNPSSVHSPDPSFAHPHKHLSRSLQPCLCLFF